MRPHGAVPWGRKGGGSLGQERKYRRQLPSLTSCAPSDVGWGGSPAGLEISLVGALAYGKET